MILILTGTNNYLLQAELRRVVDEFVEEHTDMALEKLDGEDASFERMQEAMQSLPFLAPKKMVVLQSPGANKQFVEHSARLLDELPETTDLLIVEPKLDKRSAYYKMLKKQKGYQEFVEMDENGLSKWLVAEARDKGAQLTQSDARYLVERVGNNQQVLASEVEKLSLYQPDISRTAINNLTVAAPQSTIFQLLEAAFAGNQRRALELYHEQRALKVEPIQIIAMLGWQLHVLALIKAAGKDRSPDVIAREAKISPYVVRKSATIANKLTMAETKTLVHDLLVIDGRLKSESLNADDVLLDYLLGISS